MFGISAAVRKEQCKIVGDGFVNPLVAIAGPAHHIAPPLMRHFVIGNQLGEMFLAAGSEAGALLGFRREEGKRGNVEQARPSLAEGSGNLRNAQIVKRKWPGEGLVEMDGRVNLLSELLQRVGRTRRELGKRKGESRRRGAYGIGGDRN